MVRSRVDALPPSEEKLYEDLNSYIELHSCELQGFLDIFCVHPDTAPHLKERLPDDVKPITYNNSRVRVWDYKEQNTNLVFVKASTQQRALIACFHERNLRKKA